MTTTHRAQTNVQLYGQSLAAGFDELELARLREAYDLAMRLHAARFRPSGRPFLSHVVGTASLLVSAGAPPDVVRAGLLHGAYEQADHGDGRSGMTPGHRDAVRRVVGAAVEERVAAYTELGWNLEILARQEARFDTLGPVERDALLIRVANEIDDHLDGDILYCADVAARTEYLERAEPGLARLAHRLGRPALADALLHALARCRTTPVPASLRHPTGHCFDVVPRSLWRRPRVALRHHLPRLSARLRRVLRRFGPNGA